MADPKGLRQFVKGNDCRITAPGLQAANILLAETGNFAELFLCQPSFEPNPPNGVVFAGKGKYQLYRQGNLTWRLNTETGQTCIIFATDEEWKKRKRKKKML